MVGYRTHAEPSIIKRAAELWPEGVENYVPPFPVPTPGTVASEQEDEE